MPEPLTFAAFGAATKLFELLRDAFRGGLANRRRFHDDHIKPIYEALENINQDYMSTITSFEESLRKKGRGGIDDALGLLRERKGEMRAVKDKFRGLTEAYRSPKRRKFPGKTSPFFEACLAYFDVGGTDLNTATFHRSRNYDSYYAMMLGDDFASQVEENDQKAMVADYVSAAVKLRTEITDRWKQVSLAYGGVNRDLLN
jgi:hypothetical protein